jgi:2-hydroxychromene-2-carboxylate isomerase
VSFAADLSASGLTVALDLRDPYAYLALGPAMAFGRELGQPINWLPVAGQPLQPPSAPGPADDRGIRHRRHRAHMLAREIAIYAEAQGLDLREPYRNASAEPARLAWLWVRARAEGALESFLTESFARYWRNDLDPSNVEAMAEVVASVDADPAGYLAWSEASGRETLAQLDATLAEAGLISSPSYLAANELFRGRQHLPMIRWLLGGRVGPVPI